MLLEPEVVMLTDLPPKEFDLFARQRAGTTRGPAGRQIAMLLLTPKTALDGADADAKGVGGFWSVKFRCKTACTMRCLKSTEYAMPQHAPRSVILQGAVGGYTVAVEQGFNPEVLHDLEARGHQLKVEPRFFPQETFFGGAQLVQRLAGGYLGASDHRREGQAVGF